MLIAFFATQEEVAEFERIATVQRAGRKPERVPFSEVAAALPELVANLGEDIAVLDAETGRVRRSRTINGASTFSQECFAVGYRR